MAQDQVEHRGEIGAGVIQRDNGPALAARGVEHGEVELAVIRAEGCEEVEHFLMDFVRAGVLAVDLVDDDDGLDALGEGLGEDELGLGEDAFGGVDQDDGAVDHVQDALDLAAEIGVAGGVDDVDAGALPGHGGAFGQDRDAAFAFEVVTVERPFGDLLVFAEGAGLFQELVDEGGLAMIDVRDDGDVADFHGASGRARGGRDRMTVPVMLRCT